MIDLLETKKETKDQCVVSMVRDSLKLVQNEEVLYNEYVSNLSKLHGKYLSKTTGKKRNTVDTGMHFPNTGNTKKKQIKRIRAHYEKY